MSIYWVDIIFNSCKSELKADLKWGINKVESATLINSSKESRHKSRCMKVLVEDVGRVRSHQNKVYLICKLISKTMVINKNRNCLNPKNSALMSK